MNGSTERPTRAAERLNAAIDRLLAERRPASPADADEAALLTTAVLLKEARPGADEPRAAFLAKLEERLARERRPRRAVSRRAALTGGAALAAGVAGVAIGRLAAPEPEPAPAPVAQGPVQSPAPTAELEMAEGKWFSVAQVGELPPGGAVQFAVGGVVGHLLNRDGDLVALSAICTHMGCVLRWRSAEADFLCPCHGATFAVDGAFQPRRAGTWQPSLPRLRLRVEDDQVWVWASATADQA